jgi:drug/metabolite transporter (DMT)-like permease
MPAELQPTDRRQLRAFVLLGFVMLMWAGNSIVGRAVRDDVGPFTLAFVRWAGASLVLFPFAIGSLRRDRAALRAAWPIVLTLGLTGVAAFNALMYSGLHYTTATNGLLLQAAIPPAVLIADRMIFGTRTRMGQVMGMLASMIGVAVIVFEGTPAHVLSFRFGLGDALVLVAVVDWALYTVLLRKRPAVSPLSFLLATFLVGVVAMAPLALWEQAAGPPIRWGTGVVGAFLFVALLPSLVSYLIYNDAAQVVGPARAGQAITLLPLFGAVLSALLLGEKLHAYHYAGMALILAGIVLGALPSRRQEPAGAAPGAGLEDRA